MRKITKAVGKFGLGRAVCLVLLVDLVILRMWDPAPLEALRLRTFDFYQVIQPRVATQHPVAIVDIDDESLKDLGQWPWPRTLLADLVAKLTRMGAVAIAFDVIFAEPDRLSPKVAAEAFRDLDEATRDRLRQLPDNDQVLAEAIARSKVVLGQSGFNSGTHRPEAGPVKQTGFATMGRDPSPFLVAYPDLLHNLRILENAAAGRGLLSMLPERDGIVRRIPIVMKADGIMVPSLTLEMLRVVTGAGGILIKTDEAGIRSVVLPGFELPTDRNGQLWVHFGPHDPARFVSARDVIENRVPPERIKGKLVLVGTSAVGLLDMKTTPVDRAMPGVEVHAQVIESSLTRSVLASPNFAVGAELMAAVLVSLGIIGLAPVLGAVSLFALGAAAAALLVGASWYFYVHDRLLIDFTFPLLASFLVYLTLVFTNYSREAVERRRIRSAFGQYLSPALVEQLALSPERLVLGGEQRTMSIMFSDVRNFTSISEAYKHDPQGLTALMNRFLTPLTNAILDRKGTIDKYMGDAIMAFWNAPLDDARHEVHACEAALGMIDRLEEVNRQRRQEAERDGREFLALNIGIGVNTGPCVVGNMGSDLRFDYSVLGDTVNLASRLEGQSKNYGVRTIVGSGTAAAVKEHFALLELDLIAVKGRAEPETVYTILGREDVAHTARFQELHDLNAAMLGFYRRKAWREALDAIASCREIGEEFDLARFYDLYEKRIRAFVEAPPPADWNGVFTAETK